MNDDEKEIKDQIEDQVNEEEFDENYDSGDIIETELYACTRIIPKLFDKVGLSECLKAAFTEEQMYQLVMLALEGVLNGENSIAGFDREFYFDFKYDMDDESLSKMLENLGRERIEKFFQVWNEKYKSKHPLFCSLNPPFAAPTDSLSAMFAMCGGDIDDFDFSPLPIGLAYDKKTNMPLWFGINRYAWRDMGEYHPGDIDDDIKPFEKQGYKAEIVVPEDFSIEEEMYTGRKWYPYYALDFLRNNGNKYVMELPQLHGLAIDIYKKYGDQIKANGSTLRGYNEDYIGWTVKEEEFEYGKPFYIHLFCKIDNFESNYENIKQQGEYYLKHIKQCDIDIRPEDDEENEYYSDNDRDFIRDFFIINEKEDGKAEYIFDEEKAKGAAYSQCGYVYISNCEKTLSTVLKIFFDAKHLEHEYTNIFNKKDHKKLNLDTEKPDAIVFVRLLSRIIHILLKDQLKEIGLPKYEVSEAMDVLLKFVRSKFEDGSYGWYMLEKEEAEMLKKLCKSFGLNDMLNEIFYM